MDDAHKLAELEDGCSVTAGSLRSDLFFAHPNLFSGRLKSCIKRIEGWVKERRDDASRSLHEVDSHYNNGFANGLQATLDVLYMMEEDIERAIQYAEDRAQHE